MYRSWQDSNLQSSDSKSDALSIRPHDLIVKTWGKLGFMKLGYCEITLLTAMHDLIWFVKKVGEKLLKRACAPVLISIDKSALLSRQTRSMTPSWLKVLKLVRRVINLQFFYIIDIDWRWDQKLGGVNWMFLIDIYHNWIKTKFELVGLLGNIFSLFTHRLR